MKSTTTSQCTACTAVVNIHWRACLVCQAVLEPHKPEPASQTQPLPSLTEVVREPAMKPDGSPLRPVFWEHQGRIIGPGQPEFFYQDNTGQIGLIIRYKEDIVWVADSKLRSREAFLAQQDAKETGLNRKDQDEQNKPAIKDFVIQA